MALPSDVRLLRVARRVARGVGDFLQDVPTAVRYLSTRLQYLALPKGSAAIIGRDDLRPGRMSVFGQGQ